MDNPEKLAAQGTQEEWQSNMDNPEKLATQGTQHEEKQNINTTQYVLEKNCMFSAGNTYPSTNEKQKIPHCRSNFQIYNIIDNYSSLHNSQISVSVYLVTLIVIKLIY